MPYRFSRLGVYTETQRSLAGAFRVFFCAELEVYFESIAKELAAYAEAQWQSSKPTITAMAICSMTHSQIKAPQEISNISADGGYLKRRFEAELTRIRRDINNNNGSKAHNILKMFAPLGVDEFRIDPALLSDCDTIGADRGFAVHRSGIYHQIDPQSEFDRTTEILKKLDDFEALVKEIGPLRNF